MRKMMIIITILVFLAFPVFAITSEGASEIAKEYALNELRSLRPNAIIQDATVDQVVEINEFNLWAVLVKIPYSDTVGDPEYFTKTLSTTFIKWVYIDDKGNVIKELEKISNPSVFSCSDKSSETCYGTIIDFDQEQFLSAESKEYSWINSPILKELCICYDNPEECKLYGIPTDDSAYKYTEQPTEIWDIAEQNILNSCEGWNSIDEITFINENPDYFEFQARATYPRGPWLGRDVEINYGRALLRFEKSTGKILEPLKSDGTNELEDILISQHDAKKISSEGFSVGSSFWYVPASELQNIVKYDFVAVISPNNFLYAQEEPIPAQQNRNILLIGGIIIVIIILIASKFILSKFRERQITKHAGI